VITLVSQADNELYGDCDADKNEIIIDYDDELIDM
jgi:hypothetical protein